MAYTLPVKITLAELNLTLFQFFHKYKLQMQSFFGWQDSTLHEYERKMKYLSLFTKNTTTFKDLYREDYDALLALMDKKKKEHDTKKSSKKRGYNTATLLGFKSVINRICHFADLHSNGLYWNPLWGSSWDSPLAPTKISLHTENDRIENIVKQRLKQPRSLTAIEEIHFIEQINKYVETDSRYLGAAILFYLGLRPSECCALLWGDIKPLPEYPEIMCLYVHSQLREKHELASTMKTANAYRVLPVPSELLSFMNRRRSVIAASIKADISSYPMLCSADSYTAFTNRNDFTKLCTHLLRDIRVAESTLCRLDLLLRLDKVSEADPTTYLLRRNFATALSGICGMEDDELQYLMGHSISTLTERRHDFLLPELQVSMWKKLELRQIHSLFHKKADDDKITICGKSVAYPVRQEWQLQVKATKQKPVRVGLFNAFPNDFIYVQVKSGNGKAIRCFPALEPIDEDYPQPNRLNTAHEYECAVRKSLNYSRAKREPGKNSNAVPEGTDESAARKSTGDDSDSHLDA